MKKLVVMLCGFFLAAGICLADPAEGFWISTDEKTGKDTGGWQIYLEGGKLYGKILSIADHPQTEKAYNCKASYRGFPLPGKVSDMTVVGTIWLWGLSSDRTGEWRGGNIINPDDGNMYGCRITYHPADGRRYAVETLEVRGTIGPIGRSQYWRRVTREQAASLR
jgi:uncharacterized protein (DUF2147 family)